MNQRLSYSKGPIEPPLLEYTIGEALELAAAHWPANLALASRYNLSAAAILRGNLLYGLLDPRVRT